MTSETTHPPYGRPGTERRENNRDMHEWMQRLEGKMDEVNERAHTVLLNQAVMAEKVDRIDSGVKKTNGRVDKLEDSHGGIKTKIDDTEAKLKVKIEKLEAHRNWLAGAIAVIAFLIGIFKVAIVAPWAGVK